MTKFITTIFIISVLFSCQKESLNKVKDISNDSIAINQSENNFQKIEDYCFEKVNDKDTILLKYSDNLGTVTGKMLYKSGNSEKLNGDLVGTKDGDTLKLDFLYSPEDATKSKEFWFLLKDEKLIEGKAKYDPTGSKFLDTKSIKYLNENALKAVDCNKINF